MIYTSYEMVRDCQANVPEGRRYFIRQFVPVMRRLLAHYGIQQPLNEALQAVFRPESGLFRMKPAPERPVVAELRQCLLADVAAPPASLELGIEALSAALEPLTIVEKQAVWLETMRYSPAESGEMLRMSAATVEKIRSRAAEMVRAQVDHWNARLLAENGLALGRAAAEPGAAECPSAKTFLDIVDGRMNWRGREQMEQHVKSCWHCIDHFCRLLEVVELLRGLHPLTEEEAVSFDKLLGVTPEKRGGWKKWLGA